MSIVSVTRFRVRKLRYVPLFLFYASRSMSQIRKSEGYVTGSIARDADSAFWTMTVWQSEQAMIDYVTGGAHRGAMPLLRDWGIEASVIRWQQDGLALPAWSEAKHRMREHGRASKLRHPGAGHADLSYAESPKVFSSRI
ncbi:MAG: hypothetical protein JWQ22_1096 [Devosia sp.]|nr:hypothetical protein [Devosia sp.]